ncbi:beta-1,4-galactosyltransferase 3-like, partial [Hyalella azteca]|uniref:Beta-1,4-galactosyltransferase 3-like n=1 Tax=Hyalella azteca TaxID=294128 RepID=A0A8B7P529_HYAAZ
MLACALFYAASAPSYSLEPSSTASVMTSKQSLTKERNWHRSSEISPRPSSETLGDASSRLEGVKNNSDRTIYTQITGINGINNDHSVNNSKSSITEEDLDKKSNNKLDKVTGEEPNLSSMSGELLPCPTMPPNLGGPVAVDTSSADLAEEERRHPELLPGGQWRPEECQARQKVALIIPYRSRASHLPIFLHHMHPFLQQQQLDYGIFVVEQA